MAVAIASSTSANTADANATTITVTVPASIADGEFMLMGIATAGTLADVTTPAGWTQVHKVVSGVTTNFVLAVYSRVASSEPANYVVTTSSGRSAGGIVRITGSTAVVDASAEDANGLAARSDVQCPTVTLSDTGLHITFAGQRGGTDGVVVTWTAPAGYTEQEDDSSTNVTTGRNGAIEIAYKALAAGATGAVTATASTVGNSAGVSVAVVQTAVAATHGPAPLVAGSAAASRAASW